MTERNTFFFFSKGNRYKMSQTREVWSTDWWNLVHRRHYGGFKSLFGINHMKNTFFQRQFCLLRNAKEIFN